MNRKIVVRRAEKEDLKWINSQYRIVGFKESSGDDFIVIAECNSVKAGVGRFQTIDEKSCEM